MTKITNKNRKAISTPLPGKKDHNAFIFIARKSANFKDSWRKCWAAMARHLEICAKNDNIWLSDINLAFCDDFREYLMSVAVSTKTGKRLSQNSKAAYFEAFRSMLRIAYRGDYLLQDFSQKIDSITTIEGNRTPINKADLDKLLNAECELPELKNMALFSLYTGMRWSDIEKLNPAKEIKYIDSLNSWVVDFGQKKTGQENLLPIPDAVLNLIPTTPRGEKIPFSLNYQDMQRPFKKWLKLAGLEDKGITFHGFRHTFALMQVRAGTDIFTLSSMLGHKSVRTTQVYAHALDMNKVLASKRIALSL